MVITYVLHAKGGHFNPDQKPFFAFLSFPVPIFFTGKDNDSFNECYFFLFLCHLRQPLLQHNLRAISNAILNITV